MSIVQLLVISIKILTIFCNSKTLFHFKSYVTRDNSIYCYWLLIWAASILTNISINFAIGYKCCRIKVLQWHHKHPINLIILTMQILGLIFKSIKFEIRITITAETWLESSLWGVNLSQTITFKHWNCGNVIEYH